MKAIETPNHVGARAGRLVVISYAGKIKGNHIWKMQCDCGNTVAKPWGYISSGDTKSCGCLAKETRAKRMRDAATLPDGESSFNALYGGYQRSARSRHITFTLEKVDFRSLVIMSCYYCGEKPSQIVHMPIGTKGQFLYNGLDRIDNNRGYEWGNVRPCCRQCNYAKGVFFEQDFYQWIHRVITHLHLEVR